MDETTKLNIDYANLVVVVMPERGLRAEGRRHLRYAIARGKHVILWRPWGRQHLTVPDELKTYGDYSIADGGHDVALEAARQYLEITPGDDVGVVIRGYG